jgi:hypothetical protein
VFAHVGRNRKRRLLPAHDLLGPADFFLAQRGTVRLRSVALGGSRPGNDGADPNQDRFPGFLPSGLQRLGKRREIIPVVHVEHSPAIGFKPLADILAERDVGVAVNSDVVVVVDDFEVAQLEVTGDRRRLAGHAFHHVPVAGQGPHPVVDHGQPFAIEPGREEPLRNREPDRIADALAQRSGSDLDAGRKAPLRVARSPRMQLAELLEVFHRDVVAGQVQ